MYELLFFFSHILFLICAFTIGSYTALSENIHSERMTWYGPPNFRLKWALAGTIYACWWYLFIEYSKQHSRKLLRTALSYFSVQWWWKRKKNTHTTKQREKSMSNANRTMFKKMSTENRWHFECFCNENRRHSNTHFFSIKDLNRLKKKKKRPTHIYVSPKTTVQTTITHRRRQLYPIPSYVIRLIITIFVGQAIIANDCINLNIKLTEHTIVTKAKRQRKIP